MQCPHCESQDVMLCSVARAHGTTRTTMVETGGHDAYTTQGQTAFAARCAPTKSPWKFALIVTAIVIVLDLMALQDVGEGRAHATGELVFVFASLGACALWFALIAANRPQRRARLERWHKTWVCVRCGEFFVPDR